jgi:FixJ family two-component response regulator
MPPPNAPDAPHEYGLRVLVVDDEKNVRLTIAQALEDAGYAVEAVTSAEEARGVLEAAVAERRPFAVVALDLRLPRVSGLDALPDVLALQPPPRVVMMTAHGDAASAVQALKLGAADFLEKPFPAEALLSAVWRALVAPGHGADEAADYGVHLARAREALEWDYADAADAHARCALLLDPERPEAHNVLGVALLQRGRTAEARQHFRAALAVAPGYEPAARNLALAGRPPDPGSSVAYAF